MIQREWTDRLPGERDLEPLGIWVMRQFKLDKAHYAEVEAAHKRDIESMDHTLEYWKRQADEARERNEVLFKANVRLMRERDEARAEKVGLLLDLDAARAELASLQDRKPVLPQFKRPTGRIEALEARVAKLENGKHDKRRSLSENVLTSGAL